MSKIVYVTNDVNTLATALYATTDDMLKEHPDLAPWRPPVARHPGVLAAQRRELIDGTTWLGGNPYAG